MIKTSAPGKIILFGEHAVVYNHPALAVPITHVHADVEISPAQTGIWIDAPDISLKSELSALPADHAIRCVIEHVLKKLQISAYPSLNIRITSSIPIAAGLGSGAAVSVAIIRALSTQLGSPLDNEQVNNLCYEVEKIHHGTPSGIDNTVITYSRPVYFIKGQPIETFQVKSPFILVIADTGLPAPTRESVGAVRKLWTMDPTFWNQVFEQVGSIVRQARHSIENGTWQDLGALMDANHVLLQKMTVSSAELDHLVQVAKTAGAEGAKLSGGGRGGNMIALVQPKTAVQVASALQAAGASQTIITTIQ